MWHIWENSRAKSVWRGNQNVKDQLEYSDVAGKIIRNEFQRNNGRVWNEMMCHRIRRSGRLSQSG
jgi:hypothetical protein